MTPLKFYLITDTHYFEESLGAEGKAYEEYMKTEAFYLKESSAINKAVFKKLKEDKNTLKVAIKNISKCLICCLPSIAYGIAFLII